MPRYQSLASDSFWKCYKELPKEIQQLADKAYDILKKIPRIRGCSLRK